MSITLTKYEIKVQGMDAKIVQDFEPNEEDIKKYLKNKYPNVYFTGKFVEVKKIEETSYVFEL